MEGATIEGHGRNRSEGYVSWVNEMVSLVVTTRELVGCGSVKHEERRAERGT